MAYTKLTFHNENGDAISARLDQPDGNTVAYAIFAHCFTCHKNLNAVRHISNALTAAGYAVLRFDFTGLGESEGDFADTNFSSNVSDLVQAANFLAESADYEAPTLLVGHSLGGAAVLQAAKFIESATAVATIGSPCKPDHVTHMFTCSLEEIEQNGQAHVQLAGRPFIIKKQFIDDLAEAKMKESIRNLKKALIVFHSPIDNTVGVDNAAEIFVTARHPKSFISLDDADHLLTQSADSKYVGQVLAAWAHRYVH